MHRYSRSLGMFNCSRSFQKVWKHLFLLFCLELTWYLGQKIMKGKEYWHGVMALAGAFNVKDQHLFFYSSRQHWKVSTFMNCKSNAYLQLWKHQMTLLNIFFLFPSELLSFLHKISIQLTGRIGGQLKTKLTRIIYGPPIKDSGVCSKHLVDDESSFVNPYYMDDFT